MVSMKAVDKQLKKIKFNYNAWGRGEALQLPDILMPGEQIYEAVNGLYEGGFAMMVATDIRMLLVDKKPLNFLTVEDFRFDMISEIDYNSRLVGAHIIVSTGSKTLKFTSINQQRLRKMIRHVQHVMAESKAKEAEQQNDSKQHLQQINQQLQSYLMAQHKQNQELAEQLKRGNEQQADSKSRPDPVKPDFELADYLYAQSLLAKHKLNKGDNPHLLAAQNAHRAAQTNDSMTDSDAEDMYSEGMKEVFGDRLPAQSQATELKPDQPVALLEAATGSPKDNPLASSQRFNPLEVNPLKIAYSKLPLAMRNRRFGRPSFHAHSQQNIEETPTLPATATAQ